MSSGETAATTGASTSAPRPLVVTLAAAAALAEAAALAAGAVAWLGQLVLRGSTMLGVAVFLILFALGVAAVLVAGARALRRGSRRARGPLITWQLLQVATALAVLQVPGRPGWLAGGAAVALGVALGVAGALLTPRAAAFATS